MNARFKSNFITRHLKPYWHYLRNTLSMPPEPTSTWCEEQCRFYSRFINSGDLVFDIGANIGDKSIAFSRLCRKVIAVEPQEICVKHFVKRLKKNKISEITVVNKGVSNIQGTLTLSICDSANTISTFSDKWKQGRFNNYSWGRTKLVQVTTLDDLIDQYGVPAFCKIDVEGFELKVLEGLSKPIKFISFEFTKEFLEEALLCMGKIASLGNATFNCARHGSLMFDDWLPKEKLYSKLLEITDDNLSGDIYARTITP